MFLHTAKPLKTVAPRRASTTNYKFVPTERIFDADWAVCLVDDGKNALPRFDVESQLTHQAKEGQMSGKAAEIRLTAKISRILQQLANSRSIAAAVTVRASMILKGFEKKDNLSIAGELGCSAKTVGIWRRRWRDSFDALLQMQFSEGEAQFRRAIIDCLSDGPAKRIAWKVHARANCRADRRCL